MSPGNLDAAILTIFGITGDLAQRKLLPALYYLQKDQLLPEHFMIVGVTRRGTTVDEVIQKIKTTVESNGGQCEPTVLQQLSKLISIVTMDITNGVDYVRLKTVLDAHETKAGVCLNRLFYLAIPSQVFTPVVRLIGEARLHTGCQHNVAESRVLIEKPFGFDTTSAHELIEVLSHDFTEDQIYRIDHYLAKETVQNILTFRFTNPLFENSWNAESIRQITITASEKIGIEGRATFYEQMGALRDLTQSHLLQLLGLTLMAKPPEMTSEAIHASKLAILRQVQPPHNDEMDRLTVRAQYEGYRQEVDNESSTVETFAQIQLSVDDPTWRNVPITIRTGKNLARKTTEILVVFGDEDIAHQNQLVIRIQPNEGILLQMTIKKPGYEKKLETRQMDFYYGDELALPHPDAYERVLVDATRGDKTLFATSEEVMECWRIIQPILDAWSNNRPHLGTYSPSSDGPQTA
jgi:glucose-6-phosphate 1-dehydrogenase